MPSHFLPLDADEDESIGTKEMNTALSSVGKPPLSIDEIAFLRDRQVYGDWRWLLPPLSGSTVPVYPLELENRLLKPNYFYVPDPWETESQAGKCPFHHQA